jgi:asparagine synthase (glutamine-hydrolysing)
MCGICGIINLDSKPADESQIRLMMQKIRHRGPDDEGIFISGNVGFGFVRLSILDLSEAGHQPMSTPDGRYTIVFNGEIFNYIELREDLAKSGIIFKTQTDTEVLLAAYITWGEKCLDRFNGMWAFAIYDRLENSVFLARDRYGVKPLYYYRSAGTFVFASEMQALHAVLKDNLSIDELVIFEYLTYNRTDHTCDTFIKEIKRFEHGYKASIRPGKDIRYESWYRLTDHLDNPWNSPEEYREMFVSAINIRLRSDVPLGVCLSGGLDSSSVTSVILKEKNINDLITFSAVYGQGKNGDESEFINEYRNVLPGQIYVNPTEQSLIDDFDALMQCHFEPFSDLSIYSQFKVMKDARKHITVALDGQGADEQLAGYHYFFGSFFKGLFFHLKLASLTSEMWYYYKNHRSRIGYLFFLYYSSPAAFKKLSYFNKKSFVSNELYYHYGPKSRINSLLFEPKDLNSFLVGHFENKLEHNLKWNDLNSMYHSIELRVPFMDYRLVERTLATPADKLIYKGTTKWILREAMKGILPEKIRMRQDKVGFENPSDEWFRSPKLSKVLTEAINSKLLKDSGLINILEARKLYEIHTKGKVNARKDLWKLINLNYFLERINK